MFEAIKKLLGISTAKVDIRELVAQGAIVLDVRTKNEYVGGHIKGSVNIPLDKLIDNINKLKGKNHPIITCCASGARSASAKGLLVSRGFTNVHNGGAWMSLNRKID